MIRRVVLCTFLLWTIVLNGQDNSPKLVRLEGRVVDSHFQPIPYAHVLIPASHYGVAADIFGSFTIGAYPGDTLLIRAVSYHEKRYIAPANDHETEQPVTFILEPDTVVLDELEVYAWPERDAERKQIIDDLIEQELVTALDHLTPSYKDLLVSQLRSTGAGISIPGPFSLIYSTFSKEARTRREVEKIILREKVGKRYTPALISKLTGLKHTEEINRFISFCSLDDRFILGASDYELYASIRECYKEFIRTEKQ